MRTCRKRSVMSVNGHADEHSRQKREYVCLNSHDDDLERRQDLIRKSLDDAQKAKQELEKLHVESQRILATARTEAEQILSLTRSDANRFREELKQKAQAEAAGIVKNAEKQIELETARALQQIRTEAVDISVAIASKLLARNVSKEDNERLIEETFRQLEATRAGR